MKNSIDLDSVPTSLPPYVNQEPVGDHRHDRVFGERPYREGKDDRPCTPGSNRGVPPSGF